MTENTIKVERDAELTKVNKAMYSKPEKTELINVVFGDGKKKVIEESTFANGVVKRKLKEVWKGTKRIG